MSNKAIDSDVAESSNNRSSFSTDYQVGQDNIQPLGMDIHNAVFPISAICTLLFVTLTFIFPEQAGQIFGDLRPWLTTQLDWFFVISMNFFVLFCLFVAFSKTGRIRIGGQDAKPDFSYLGWLAMLFSAGIGIGLMFFGVLEPVNHALSPPLGVEAGSPEAEGLGVAAAVYHWGLHAWAVYAVVGLSLAYFCFNHGLPLTLRSAFFPILGDRVWGIPGHIIDTLAVFATIFGLATSLGLGASQAAGGLNFLFGIENNISTQVGIIVAISAIAIFSVVRGLDGGVKVLSNLNMTLAAILLLFVVFAGSIAGFFGNLFGTVSAYAQDIIPLSNWVDREDEKFYKGWTVFYWAWWVSWSPFVGMFIARVSKGRTVREFMVAVLLIPTLVSAVWMAAFGAQALDQIQGGVGQLSNGLGDVSLAMFQMLENLPMAEITSAIAIVLVLVFFITSSDSGSLVIDSITAGCKVDAPVPQRIFWAVLQGLIAGVLLYGGGSEALKALQAGAITTGLPFTAILLLMCVSIYKGLKSEV